MGRSAFVLGVIAVVFVLESTCQFRIIHPTYRPPPSSRQPIIRTARAADNEPQPLWLHQGDDVIRAPSTGEHPFLPSIIDDVKLDPSTRYARSLSFDGSSSVDDDAQDFKVRYTRSLGTPGHGRVGTNDRQGNSGSRGHDTGATHPGYNRRNARSLPSIGLPDYATTPPFNPKPWPGFPKPNSRTRF